MRKVLILVAAVVMLSQLTACPFLTIMSFAGAGVTIAKDVIGLDVSVRQLYTVEHPAPPVPR